MAGGAETCMQGRNRAFQELYILDSFSREGGERPVGEKELAKASKSLKKLFPNYVTLHPPHDEQLLTVWKRQIEKDEQQVSGY